jgi:hypothetical protein
MTKSPRKKTSRRRKLADAEMQLLAQLLARAEAIRILLTIVLADRFERDQEGPEKAAERTMDTVFRESNRGTGGVSMAISEEIASIVTAAAQIALNRSSGK